MRNFGHRFAFKVQICAGEILEGRMSWEITVSSSKWEFEKESGKNFESSCQLSKNIECYLLDSVLKEKSVRHFSVEKYTFQQNRFPATAFNHYWVIKDSCYWNLKLKWVWAKKTAHIQGIIYIGEILQEKPIKLKDIK